MIVEPAALHRPAAVLRDPDADRALVEDGFARVPLFDPARLQALWASHQERVGAEAGITFDTIRPDRSAMRRTTEEAAPLWAEVVDGAFIDHEVIFSAFVVKYPGDFSGMAPHDDRTFVDERTTRSVTVWIPLVDCGPDEDNGWIGVIPGSHRAGTGLSGTATPDWFARHRRVVTEHLVPVPARAGEAVVWDSRMVHGSPPNRSDQPRPVLVSALVPKGAPLVHVRATSRRGRRIYSVDASFHLDHSPLDVARRMPDYPVLADVVDPDPIVDPEVIQALCGLDAPPAPETERPKDDPLGDGSACTPLGPTIADPNAAPIAEHLASCAEACIGDLDGTDPGAVLAPGACAVVADGATELGRKLLPNAIDQLAAAAAPHVVDLIVVAPGTSLLGDDAPECVAAVPLAQPVGPAGLAWADGALPFELGLAVAPPAGEPLQFWNEGRDPVPLLVARRQPARAQVETDRRLDVDTAQGDVEPDDESDLRTGADAAPRDPGALRRIRARWRRSR
ncbi:MAG: phytanoyl-CoA dioxygenase family protein [Aquihabitans sp.]